MDKDREYYYTPTMHQVWHDEKGEEISEVMFSQALGNKIHIKLNKTGTQFTIINTDNNKVLAMCATRQVTYKERLK